MFTDYLKQVHGSWTNCYIFMWYILKVCNWGKPKTVCRRWQPFSIFFFAVKIVSNSICMYLLENNFKKASCLWPFLDYLSLYKEMICVMLYKYSRILILYSKSQIFWIFLYWTVVYGLKTISNSFKVDLVFHFWPNFWLSLECCWKESSTPSNRIDHH